MLANNNCSASFCGHGAVFAARHPCWHSLSAFPNHPAARRYARSTSAASRRDAVRVRLLFISSSLCLPLRPASRIRLQIPSSKAFPHPFVPSPGPARTAALRPQFALEASKFDFLAFQKSSYFLLPFFLDQIAKINDFGFPKQTQNRSIIHSKSTSQKTCDFSSNFARKLLCCNSADIDFVSVFLILFACRAFFFESLFECIWGPKNLPKTNPKRRPNPLKIDVKNVSFFNIVFFGFQPRCWTLLGIQLGAKLAQNRKNLVWVWSGCGLQSLLKIDVLKNRVLERSGLDFGASGPRF